MASGSPSIPLTSAARRFAAFQPEANLKLPSSPSWADLERLVRNPYLFSTEQASAFIDILDCCPALLPFISSISLEDQSLTIDAYTPKWPLQTLDELKTWRSLCEYISLLSSNHNLRNLSLAVTACKMIQEDFDADNGEHFDEPAKVWSEPITLDRLALTGCDLQQPDLLQYFRPKETIIYTAAPAWPSTGLGTLIAFTTSPTVEVVVGSFPIEGSKVILIDTLVSLNYRGVDGTSVRLLIFSVRDGLSEQSQLEDMVRKVKKAGLVEYDIQLKTWLPRGANQLEAERAEWSDGRWVNRKPTTTNTRPDEENSSHVGKHEDWDKCANLDSILRESGADNGADPVGDKMRDLIEAALADQS